MQKLETVWGRVLHRSAKCLSLTAVDIGSFRPTDPKLSGGSYGPWSVDGLVDIRLISLPAGNDRIPANRLSLGSMWRWE